MYKEQKATDAISLTEFPNKPLQAYYSGSKQVNTKFGEQWLHEFEKKDGKKVSIWGFTALNRLLENTKKGVMCKVTYMGKTKEKNKYGNQSHTCSLFFEEDDTLQSAVEPDVEVEDNSDLPF